MLARTLSLVLALSLAACTTSEPKPEAAPRPTAEDCRDAYFHTTEVKFRENGMGDEQIAQMMGALREVIVDGKTEGAPPEAIAQFKDLVDKCTKTYTRPQTECLKKVQNSSEIGGCAAAK
jgi:hypothetical protein